MATYNSVKEAIISHIQKSYTNGQDVVKSLKTMVIVDLQAMEPSLLISNDLDDTRRSLEQAGYNIKYQEELRRHMDRTDALEEGMSKAYALIMNNYTTRAMQARVEEH